jgi:hypothetical protein
MALSAFADKRHPLTDHDLARVLDRTFARWRDLQVRVLRMQIGASRRR